MTLIGPEICQLEYYLYAFFMILSICSSAAYSVECLGLKPYWLGKKRQYSSTYNDTCLCIIFSNTFEIVGKGKLVCNFQIVVDHLFCIHIGITLAIYVYLEIFQCLILG